MPLVQSLKEKFRRAGKRADKILNSAKTWAAIGLLGLSGAAAHGIHDLASGSADAAAQQKCLRENSVVCTPEEYKLAVKDINEDVTQISLLLCSLFAFSSRKACKPQEQAANNASKAKGPAA